MKTIKKGFFAVLAMSSTMLLFSCASPLSCRLDDYVDEVESNCQDWTEKDWELSKDEYAKLMEEYESEYDSYTQEERDAINKAIGRYYGLLIKRGIEDVGSIIEELGERLPSLIEGFMSAFETEDNKEEQIRL